MSITELVAQNKSLVFIDAQSCSSMSFNEILEDEPVLGRSKSLAFLYVDNSLNSIIAFWNFIRSAHTIALLSPKMNLDHKENLEKLYSPYYIYDPSRIEIDTFKERPFVHGLTLFERDTISTYIIHPKVKVLLSTSGTTGSPKFVKLSEENILQNALSITDYLPIRSDDVTPLNLPIYYSYGLSVLTSNSLAGGSIIASNKDIMTKDFWSDFEKFGFTSLAGVPFVYEMLNRIGFAKRTYPSLRYLTQAGGRLNEKTVAFFANYCSAHGVSFYVMYGQTEATARMSYLAPEYVHKKPGSIGKAIKNGKFMIDPETSELYYEGPNVFGGYASSYSDIDTYNEDQLLRTGDLARKDDDDYFYITGRLKRFVKLMGSRVNLDEVEAILKNKFPCVTFVCIGLEDKKMLVGQVSGNISHKAITDFLVAELKIHPTVFKVKNMDEMPLTINGKPDYNCIYETYKS